MTSAPRASWTRKGKRSDAKSISGATMRARFGSDAATTPISCETLAETATSRGLTPTRRANEAREPSVASPQCSQLVRPARQSASAAWSASNAGRGGSP